MQAKAGHHAPRQAVMNVMSVPVLHAQRDNIQQNLREKPGQDQTANGQTAAPLGTRVFMIQFRQEMQEREAQQIGSREGIEQLNVRRPVEVEQEKANAAE